MTNSPPPRFSVFGRVWWVAAALALLAGLVPTASAATLGEQRRELNRASTSLRTATRMLAADRKEDAAAAFEEAQTVLQGLSEGLDPKLRRNFERTLEQLAETHGKLSSGGVDVAALATITITEATGKPNLGSRGGPPTSDQISFATVVAPLLASKCGSCHVDRSQGGFGMSSYNALMRSGVIEVGSGAESRLIDVIASGTMPPNGNTVSPEETQRLLRWVNQGAKFDGDDPDKSLRDVRAGSGTATAPQPAPAMPKAAIPAPKGNETVSFSLDIAPLLAASCVECHREGNTGAMLNLGTFEQLWKGGNSGAAIVPEKPAESLLVAKLKGTAEEGGRMPLNRPAWGSDKISLVEKWISEGASFDGPSPSESLARVAAIVKANRSTSDELNRVRLSEAERQWRLALPDETAAKVETERFLLVGNLPEQQLAELGTMAEKEADRVLKLFSQSDEPLNKSRLTLFVFRNRIDYSEFGTMVERRDLGGSQQNHAMFDLVHPYGAIVSNPGDSDTEGRMLAQVVGELWYSGVGEGKLPGWLTSSTGRAIAARLWPKDKQVAKWKESLPSVAASLTKPEGFMTGDVPPATSEVAGFGFVDALMHRPGNVLKWARQVGEGQDVDEAAKSVFRRTPTELAELWVASLRRPGR